MDTSEPSADARLSSVSSLVTGAGAVAVAAGGALHLKIWDQDYRDLPEGAIPGLWVVQTGFPINAAVSVVVAAAMLAVALGAVARGRHVVLATALAVQIGSIVALVASRGPGIFGWSEKGYDGGADTILVVEIVAVVLILAALLSGRPGTFRRVPAPAPT